MYKVKKATKIINGKKYNKYFICNPHIPIFHLCKFLDLKGKNSINTQKTYSSILVQWLNFLLKEKKKRYYVVETQDIKTYIYSLIFFDKNERYILTPNIVYKTLQMKNVVIFEFYKFLLGEMDTKTSMLYIETNKKRLNYQFSLDIKELLSVGKNSIEYFMTKYKSSRKENYIVNYSEDEIFAITSNFNNLRDKLVFKLTLYGYRIDEVLSIKTKDFNTSEDIIKPSRSKTNKNRLVVLDSETSKNIINYIITERMDAISYSGLDSEYLFINLRKGKYCGQPLKYETFYKALKRSGVNSGLKKEQIRTHSGRSTKVMDLMIDGNFSDEQVRLYFGWKSPTSINSYIEENNKSLALKGSKFISQINGMTKL